MIDLSKLSIGRLKALKKKLYSIINHYEGCCEFGCCKNYENRDEIPEYIEARQSMEKLLKELGRKQREERKKIAPKFDTFKLHGDKTWYIIENK
jgi:hypothetical protein